MTKFNGKWIYVRHKKRHTLEISRGHREKVDTESKFFEDVQRTCYDSFYPFKILSACSLERIDFEPVTILYGENELYILDEPENSLSPKRQMKLRYN